MENTYMSFCEGVANVGTVGIAEKHTFNKGVTLTSSKPWIKHVAHNVIIRL